jgi:hypothetical protein
VTEQQEKVETELVLIQDDDDLEPLSLEYDDEDAGTGDEPASAQLEPDYPDLGGEA